MIIRKRQALLWVVALYLGTATSAFAQKTTDAFPSRPIRLVVPYAAGGGTDILARQLAKQASDRLGQQIVVDNKPGAGTVLGAADVARATPDGYTLLWGDSATFSVNPHVYRKISYDPLSSFTPVTLTVRGATVLAVSPRLGVKNVAELIAYVKTHPGKLSYGTPGNATPHHLAMEAFKIKAGGLEIEHVPYKGEAPALQDLVAGNLSLMFSGPRIAKAQADAGTVLLLATAGAKRNLSLPALPTVAEAGLQGFAAEYWHGIVAPAGTPSALVNKLNSAFVEAIRSPELVAWIKQSGAGTEWTGSTPAEMGTHMQRELQSAGKLVKAINLQMD